MVKIDTPITANAASIDRVLQTPLPKILVFYHSGNGGLPAPLDQMMKTIAKASVDQLLITKIDLADNPDLKTRYQISSSPALIAVKDGQEVGRADQPNAVLLQQYADYLTGRSSQLPQAEPKPQPTASTGGASKPFPVSDSSFANDVLQSDLPVLVDFWAAWCGPCQMVAPILEKLAAEFAGQIKIAKVDVDANPALSQAFRIQSIPNLMIVKERTMIFNQPGALPEESLRNLIEQAIALEIPAQEAAQDAEEPAE